MQRLICIHWLFFMCVCVCLSRGNWSWCGKHWVLPWRNGQCKHQWCKRPGWPQQPAELRQWRGLLHLQPETGLFCLKHQPILSLSCSLLWLLPVKVPAYSSSLPYRLANLSSEEPAPILSLPDKWNISTQEPALSSAQVWKSKTVSFQKPSGSNLHNHKSPAIHGFLTLKDDLTNHPNVPLPITSLKPPYLHLIVIL